MKELKSYLALAALIAMCLWMISRYAVQVSLDLNQVLSYPASMT